MCNCFPWSLLPGYFSCLLTNVVIESSWFYHLMSKHHLSNGFVYYDSCFPLFQKLLLVYIQATCLFTEFFVMYMQAFTWMDVWMYILHRYLVTWKLSNIYICNYCKQEEQEHQYYWSLHDLPTEKAHKTKK